MRSRVVLTVTPAGLVETGIITLAGRDYTAGGAAISDEALICYPDGQGQGRTWGGDVIGHYRVTGHTRAYGTRLTCYRITLEDGRQYHGRGLGPGMILRARRCARKAA